MLLADREIATDVLRRVGRVLGTDDDKGVNVLFNQRRVKTLAVIV